MCVGVGPLASKASISADTGSLVGEVEKESSGSPGDHAHALARRWGNCARCWAKRSARVSGTPRGIVVIGVFSLTQRLIICAVK
jgi:hypothetical protein